MERVHEGRPRQPWDHLERTALIEWLRFHVDCENYDRLLPGNWKHGEWLPGFGVDKDSHLIDGMQLSRTYAAARKDQAESVIRKAMIPIGLDIDVRRYLQKLTHDQRVDLLAHLTEKDSK